MRKEDRIRQQGQSVPEKEKEKPQPRPSEQVKGQAEPDRPTRPSGVLPIPD